MYALVRGKGLLRGIGFLLCAKIIDVCLCAGFWGSWAGGATRAAGMLSGFLL